MHIADDNCKKVEVSNFKSIESYEYEVWWMGQFTELKGSEHVFLKCKLLFHMNPSDFSKQTDNAKDISFLFQDSNKFLLAL